MEPTDAASAPAGIGPTALFEREHAAMLRVAVLLIGSAPAAEDIVSDAFASVGERWDHIDNPGGYLRSCVVNGCRMALRRQGAEERATRRIEAPSVAELSEPLVDLARALSALDERQRTVVVLRYLDDRPDEEIAELLGCRPVTVRSIASRALRKLREELS